MNILDAAWEARNSIGITYDRPDGSFLTISRFRSQPAVLACMQFTENDVMHHAWADEEWRALFRARLDAADSLLFSLLLPPSALP